MNTEYEVIDVCRHIIEYCNKKNYRISNLRLQKILYFSQKYFIRFCGRKLFHENIEAWAFGPVIPAAYSEYKHFGAGEIIWDDKKGDIKSKDAMILNSIVDSLSKYTDTQLLYIVCKEEPWIRNYSIVHKNVIPAEDLKK